MTYEHDILAGELHDRRHLNIVEFFAATITFLNRALKERFPSNSPLSPNLDWLSGTISEDGWDFLELVLILELVSIAEYMALSEAAKEALYLNHIAHELGLYIAKKVVLYTDSANTEHIINSPGFPRATR
ncbi:uncharacterized protein BO97DRAFT_427176 [Aspergillus homomorphus CBS 101889]|uniref:Uncharacterized protein n=1 Tax=Aspergillus homomorphus (strain CBS 101889) TaxID=1450537 RepID=A0A395HU64_ASPHC|nr:hypothetical protein BO97DRAFT_427176 [Aspergillus homomorphus CBS 101889]RAL09754.1 hypothetical protein BO97DRAFT_427176 [Aspergillus homomorphus CBS 101889]